jgi:hypothetical protein
MITEYELYSDERKDTPKGYLILGGIVCTDRGRERLLVRLSETRKRHGLGQEIGWGKVSKSYLDGFKAYLDVFFDDPHARYSVLVVHLVSAEGHASLGKMRHDDMLASIYYQFLHTTFGRLSDTKRWWVFPDAGFFSRDTVLKQVEFLFNRTYKKAHGPKTSRIIRLARARDSKQNELIQLADLMLGCVACAKFAYAPKSVAKLEFLTHFEARRDASLLTERGLSRFVIQSWVPPEQFEYPAWGAKSPGAPQ